jgi:5-methyltetrahydrofolate--homocysteine methyltransferase
MLIIGERINSTRSSIKELIKARNSSLLLSEARSQLGSGANYVDINCAVTSGSELQDMDWAINVIQSDIKDVSISIDSPNYLAIEKALAIYKGAGSIMINSITGEDLRMRTILPLALKYKTKLIALAMDERGMPETANDRFEAAKKILARAKSEGMKEEDIYFDPLIRPISTEPKQAREFLDAIGLIKSLGRVNTICGLSNVSYGLPNRSLINSVFLSMAVKAGLDAAILDPLDRRVMSAVYASEALVGVDDYCANYIRAFREEALV